MKLEGTFSGVISSGLVMVGDLVGNKLIKPRVFAVIDSGKQMQLSPLPGTPHFVKLTGDYASWPIPEDANNKSLWELWERATKELPRIVAPAETMGIKGN